MGMQLATRAFGVIDISEVQNKLDSIEQLESKLKAQQELIDIMREALEFCAIDDLFTSNGEYNELFKYNYKIWFQDVSRQALAKL